MRTNRELLLLRTGLGRFIHQSESFARDAGLTPAQHQLLLAIQGHDVRDGPTVGDVTDYLLLRHHSVVELVDRAVAADLVARREDARVVRLELTELVRAVLERLSARNLDELRRLADHFRPLWQSLDEERADEEKRRDAQCSNDIHVTRVYDTMSEADGPRVLVDRLWPRGVTSNEPPPFDQWLRDIGPSTALRRWYGHDPKRFEEFAARYRSELHGEHAYEFTALLDIVAEGPLTLLTATKDVTHSAATILADELRAWVRTFALGFH